ncbi:MAG: DUF2384 domain-containing protein [Chitinophagaceae bacterium]|jgi:putative toxin-antitoxin system antitoxin component (TIGR02293 family)|nr:DUF2384 domain-containing protein [Chitinophagaceae bacterium]
MRVKKRKGSIWMMPEEAAGGTPQALREAGLAYGRDEAAPLRLLNIERHAENYASESALYLSVIRGGLPRHSLDALLEKTGLTLHEMSQILDTTDRTLRRHEPGTLLSREHSERLLEIARLYSRGEEVFGSLDVFRAWMGSPIPALGGLQPKSFLDTSLGIGLLMSELGRIEHGVFA